MITPAEVLLFSYLKLFHLYFCISYFELPAAAAAAAACCLVPAVPTAAAVQKM